MQSSGLLSPSTESVSSKKGIGNLPLCVIMLPSSDHNLENTQALTLQHKHKAVHEATGTCITETTGEVLAVAKIYTIISPKVKQKQQVPWIGW